MSEQQALRETVETLQQKVKDAQSPGYARMGQQFEETLRLAETEAAKLVNDAAKEALRIREEAKNEAEKAIADAESTLAKLPQQKLAL